MVLLKILFVASILGPIHAMTYLYNTADSSSAELYDCIALAGVFYCRRPTALIVLNRSTEHVECHHNGTSHSFADLRKDNVSISTILYHWRSSLEKVEQYARYLEDSSEANGHLCNCTDPRSFGRNCEYAYPVETTLAQTLAAQSLFKRYHPFNVQLYGDIICYTTLDCDSGLLCLDWRDICDGVQQCMRGVDEENCEKLEFNECDEDEYRCMNGMCIPEEYFLDGVFDCLDWSDELQYYDDANCPIEETNFRCDDRICPPKQFSCGDGQCLTSRLEFQTLSTTRSECRSRREQYFMCETHYRRTKWTLPNGRCYENLGYEEPKNENQTKDMECQYLLRCALSGGVERHCPCGRNSSCNILMNHTCPSNNVQYQKKGIMAPYMLFFYYRTRSPVKSRPDFSWINGTIKCNRQLVALPGSHFSYISTLEKTEESVCRYARNRSWGLHYSEDQHYQAHPFTFNKHPYSAIDLCNSSKANISTYRIKDGFDNCVNQMDETANIPIDAICSKMQRHRFRCSSEEPTCLSVTALGDLRNNCKNMFDELWWGTSAPLLAINCNSFRTDQCSLLRQYIEMSWTSDRVKPVTEQLRIPFHRYCDTFVNLASNEDENVNECKASWVCSDDEWRCHSGQCIREKWVLDEEWDCADASDEDNLLYWPISDRNLQVVSQATLENRTMRQKKSIPFSSLCNLTTEYPCLPVHFSSPLVNLSGNRPCIRRDRVGDGKVDCYGAIDERNTLMHCNQPTALGYHFQCTSTRECIPYWNHCIDRCNNTLDDQVWCEHKQNFTDYVDGFHDAICFNGTYVKDGRCNRMSDCLYGEDEYMCGYANFSKLSGVPYRTNKAAEKINHVFRLRQLPATSNITEFSGSTAQTNSRVPTDRYNQSAPIAYWCNRGVGAYLFDRSIACFCPPQYYGDKCQFHADRITVLLHLNFSQSTYMIERDFRTVLKILILFLHENEVIRSHLIHVRPESDLFKPSKKIVQFPYSRAAQLLKQKAQRYRNQTDVNYRHPYAVRIEIYERKYLQESVLSAVWQYPIYFDYLPVFRLAKILQLTVPSAERNPCSSYPCHTNAVCQPLVNDKSKYICLCKNNFTGENCSSEDSLCATGYCRSGSLCKPNYRGLLVGNDFPLCLCPGEFYGERCNLRYEQCSSNPCFHGGSCYPASRPGSFICDCPEGYQGEQCQLIKPEIKLHINESASHIAAVVQYFDIDFASLDLVPVQQSVYRTLPPVLHYQHKQETAPEIVMVKLYSFSPESHMDIYLLAVQVNVTILDAVTQATEPNRCPHVRSVISENHLHAVSSHTPIKYHYLCQNVTDLLCFRDDFYFCICEESHRRAECFRYDAHLDRCSHCLAGGRCLQADRRQPSEYICLCPACHSGVRCQFNSNSFGFTLDQLFFTDLISNNARTAMRILLIIPLLLFLLAIPNNLFSFITFRQQNCLTSGVGHYLICMSVVNQLNLGFLAARVIHLVVNITGLHSHGIVDEYLCKILGYLLTSSSRMVYWLSSLVALERVSMTLFMSQQWIRKPRTARRLIFITFVGILVSDAHELVFIKSLAKVNSNKDSMCVLEFPQHNRSAWLLLHRILSIVNSIAPLLINMCCMVTIIYVVTKTKMNTRMKESEYKTTIQQQDQAIPKSPTLVGVQTNLRLAVDVLRDKHELVIGPAITLVPQLFSLPLFVVSFTLYCQNLESSWLRYPLIVSYFTTFMPQLTSFMLYVLPSSLYSEEWYNTSIGQWFWNSLHRQRPIPIIIVSSETTKEFKST